MIKAQTKWVKRENTFRYKEGDKVWLERCNLQTDCPTPKLAAWRHGPFRIKKVLSPVTLSKKGKSGCSQLEVRKFDIQSFGSQLVVSWKSSQLKS